jgi:hypothetical protein
VDFFSAGLLGVLGNVSGWVVAFVVLIGFVRAILKDQVVTRGRLDDALEEIKTYRDVQRQQAAALDRIADSMHTVEQFINALPSPRSAAERADRYDNRQVARERSGRDGR